jgi:hypothetical protein
MRQEEREREIWEGSVSRTQRKARRGKGEKGRRRRKERRGKDDRTQDRREGLSRLEKGGRRQRREEKKERRDGRRGRRRRRFRWRTSSRPWESRGWRFWVREEVERERKPAGREDRVRCGERRKKGVGR